MAGLLTTVSRVERVEAFSTKNLYLGVGKTTPWTDENTPDVPLVSDTDITELSFVKKLDDFKFVRPFVGGDTEDTITYKSNVWTIIDVADIYTEEVTAIYLEFNLEYDTNSLPTDISFRQVGVLQDPIDVAGPVICTDAVHLAADVSDVGVLHYIENREPIYRQDDQKEKITLILEF